MVRIVLSDRTFEYDVRSLTKAFFKNEDMEVVDIDSDCDEAEFTFKVFTSLDEIKLEIYNKEKDINNEVKENISSKIENIQTQGYSNITFIIGGTLGLTNEVLSRANESICFSKMTFPHHLMRLMRSVLPMDRDLSERSLSA